ncbi:MAG: hypothetical protein ABH803_01425 [Candidatus Micrarchaeota archaeon]
MKNNKKILNGHLYRGERILGRKPSVLEALAAQKIPASKAKKYLTWHLVHENGKTNKNEIQQTLDKYQKILGSIQIPEKTEVKLHKVMLKYLNQELKKIKQEKATNLFEGLKKLEYTPEQAKSVINKQLQLNGINGIEQKEKTKELTRIYSWYLQNKKSNKGSN